MAHLIYEPEEAKEGRDEAAEGDIIRRISDN
jgi:hypothetical protein